jgi:hypothetical protein
MRTTTVPRRLAGPQAVLLVEMLVYLALVALIAGLALGTFFKFWDASRRLEQTADGTIRALQAGERWRADVRQATGPLRAFAEGEDLTLEIPQGDMVVAYYSAGDGVWRRAGETSAWVHVLPQAQRSVMIPDPRQQVAAWRWEVELSTGKRTPRTKPRFTFLAVPGPEADNSADKSAP